MVEKGTHKHMCLPLIPYVQTSSIMMMIVLNDTLNVHFVLKRNFIILLINNVDGRIYAFMLACFALYLTN